jgi:5-methylcytosine-specific restriction endonuclease McrA
MTNISPATLSDHDLLVATDRAAATERQATAALLALLGEVGARELYAREGFSSLFRFATERLRLSEAAAYSRITAARAARRFPVVLTLIDDGTISLTTVALLSGHLTDDNHEALLGAARGKSKRQVEQLVAALHPQPDIASSVRALPTPGAQTRVRESVAAINEPGLLVEEPGTSPKAVDSAAPPSAPQPRPAVVAPIAPRRYLIRMTIGEETHEKLQRARDLLRHTIPSGDPAAIVDRALTVLLERTEQARVGATTRPRSESGRRRPTGHSDARSANGARYLSADVRRTVWARDQGRCAFAGLAGRCTETGGLEFHHVIPFARGGPSNPENLELRCRAHNAFEAKEVFGDWRPRARKNRGASASALAGQS